MVFKARDMPKFDKPFSPDHSKAALVTQSLDFSFRTDLRLGKAATAHNRKDLAASQLGDRLGGAGYGADPFMANLRSSPHSSPRGSSGVSQARATAGSPLSPRSSLRSPLSSSVAATVASRLSLNRTGVARDAASVASPSSPRGCSSPHFAM